MIGMLEKRYVRYPVYVAFFFFVFIVSLVIAFPDDEVKDILTVQIEKALDHKYKVTIEDLDLWWLTGVQLENVTVEERKTGEDTVAKDELEGGPELIPMKFTLPEVSARLSVIRSILGPTVEFSVDVGGGEIEGIFRQGSDSNTLEADFDEVDLRKTQAIAAFLGVPFFGDLSGEIDLELDPKRNLPQSGSITFDGEKLTFGPSTVQTDKLPAMAFIEVPQTNLGTLDIDIIVDESNPKRPVMKIETFKMEGRDMRGDVWGDIRMSPGSGNTVLDTKMRMQFDETFVKKNSLAPLLNVSEVAKGKNKQWYGFQITGRTSNVQFRGRPASAAGPKAEPPKAPEKPESDEK
jgi:type II secretion system protein N